MEQGDTLPILEFEIRMKDGGPLGLPAAAVIEDVRILMKHRDAKQTDPPKVDASVTSYALSVDGKVLSGTYEWAPEDTDEPGDFYRKIVVVLADERRMTFPNKGLGIVLNINEALHMEAEP